MFEKNEIGLENFGFLGLWQSLNSVDLKPN